MTTPRTLEGRRILVTRPAHQAENLCRLIEARGGKPVRLPLISIEPLAHTAPVARLMESARSWDGWIFTSANAVRHAEKIHRGSWCTQLAAVGAATTAAIEAGGREIAVAPLSAYSGEALAALPEFTQIAGKRYLIVTGQDGLDTLAQTLQARGAEVAAAEVYRRVPIPYDEATVLTALRGAEGIVITSGEALEHLWRLTPESSRPSVLKKQIVAPSARVVEMAQRLGFARTHAPAQMSDLQIIAVLETLPGTLSDTLPPANTQNS